MGLGPVSRSTSRPSTTSTDATSRASGPPPPSSSGAATHAPAGRPSDSFGSASAHSDTARSAGPTTPRPSGRPDRSARAAAARGAGGAGAAVDVTDAAQRERLIQGSSQINPLSQRVGNSQDVCAGAALTNGILMDCHSAADCQRNANALRNAADKYGGFDNLSDAERERADQAIDHLQSGHVSPQDAQYLHQVMYGIAQGVQGNVPGGGVSAAGMLGAVSVLRAEGAFGASNPNFHLANLPNGVAHWTVSSGGTFANSLPANLRSGPAQVSHSEPPETQMLAGNARWQGTVSADADGHVTGTWRQGSGSAAMPATSAGEAYSTSIDPAPYRHRDSSDAPQALVQQVLHAERVRIATSSSVEHL